MALKYKKMSKEGNGRRFRNIFPQRENVFAFGTSLLFDFERVNELAQWWIIPWRHLIRQYEKKFTNTDYFTDLDDWLRPGDLQL